MTNNKIKVQKTIDVDGMVCLRCEIHGIAVSQKSGNETEAIIALRKRIEEEQLLEIIPRFEFDLLLS